MVPAHVPGRGGGRWPQIRVPLAGTLTGKGGLLVTPPIRAHAPQSLLMHTLLMHTELVLSIRKPLGEGQWGAAATSRQRTPSRTWSYLTAEPAEAPRAGEDRVCGGPPRGWTARESRRADVWAWKRGEAGGGAALPSGLRARAEAEAVSTSRPGPPPRSQRPAFTRNSLSRDMGR